MIQETDTPSAALRERNALLREVTNIPEAAFYMPQSWHDRLQRLDLSDHDQADRMHINDALQPTLRTRTDQMGTTYIMLDRGDGSEPFDFIQINYRSPFTDNAGNRVLAEKVLALLTARTAPPYQEPPQAIVVEGAQTVPGQAPQQVDLLARRDSLPLDGAGDLAEADRRAGAAERELAVRRDEVQRMSSALSRMKAEAGYDDTVLFDRVWSEVLAKSKGVPSPDDVLCAGQWRWLTERYEVHFRDGRFISLVNITSDRHRESLSAIVSQHMAGDWSAALVTAQPSGAVPESDAVPLVDGTWYWVRYEAWGQTIEAPAMFKAPCEAFYSFEFSGIPTRQIKVMSALSVASAVAMPSAPPKGDALLAAEPDQPRSMDCAPRDGTIVRLLVQFEEHALEDDNSKPLWTIGGNTFDLNQQSADWQFAGWSWSQDRFTEGVGTPIAWLPLAPEVSKPVGAADTPVPSV